MNQQKYSNTLIKSSVLTKERIVNLLSINPSDVGDKLSNLVNSITSETPVQKVLDIYDCLIDINNILKKYQEKCE